MSTATVRTAPLPDDDEPVDGGEPVGIPSLADIGTGLVAAFGRGRTVAAEAARLGAEIARVVRGASDLEPAKGDRRFTDPAWSANPVYRRIEQAYLAWVRALHAVVDEAAQTEDFRQVERARFTVNLLTSAWAPTNFLPTNPAALKRAFDTGGGSLVAGLRNFVDDIRNNGGMPSQVKRDEFVVGHDLAVTAGAVVDRDEVAELLQYAPTTHSVHERPVLVVPPPIGRFYFLDLRPGRSFVEYAVGRGLQTFLLSWRNATAEQGGWDLDTYADRVSRAIDAVREVTGANDINVIGFCAGGIINTTLLNHMAATGDDRVHSASYAVTLLDFSTPAPIAAFSGPGLLGFARRRSQRTGVITSRQMGAAFSLMRPDDLIFNYWVNNYLMGEDPPAFDILAWSVDGTNLPAALHCQFLDVFERNILAEPGRMEVLGTPLHFDQIKVPMFVTGAVSDHLTPWKGCYRTTQLLSGDSTFVLSFSGHIASLVNPPGNPKAHYWTGPTPGPDPDEWLAAATEQQGSWWEAWADWVIPRSGEERPAGQGLGSRRHRPIEDAPGPYVRG